MTQFSINTNMTFVSLRTALLERKNHITAERIYLLRTNLCKLKIFQEFTYEKVWSHHNISFILQFRLSTQNSTANRTLNSGTFVKHCLHHKSVEKPSMNNQEPSEPIHAGDPLTPNNWSSAPLRASSWRNIHEILQITSFLRHNVFF